MDQEKQEQEKPAPVTLEVQNIKHELKITNKGDDE